MGRVPDMQGPESGTSAVPAWPLPAVSPICYAGRPPAGALFQVQRASIFLGMGKSMPTPARQAFEEDSAFFVGQGKNGRLCQLSIEGRAYCAKMTHYRPTELAIYQELADARAAGPGHREYDHILIPEAFLMGEPDPHKPHRLFCYHIAPQLTADLGWMMESAFHSRTATRELAGQGQETDDAASMAGVLTHYRREADIERISFSVSLLKRVVQAILQGLSFLHDCGIAHNDLKPGNVLYQHCCKARHHNNVFACTCGPVSAILPQIRICDFDMATNRECRGRKDFRTPQARAGKLGTRGYSPPEWQMADSDTRGEECKADVWSMGCTLLRLLVTRNVPLNPEDAQFLFDYQRRLQLEDESEDEGEAVSQGDIEKWNALIRRDILLAVFPSWNGLHQLIGACLTVDPQQRPGARDLLPQQEGADNRRFRSARAFWSQ